YAGTRFLDVATFHATGLFMSNASPSARLLLVVLLVTLIVAAKAVALLFCSILIILDPASNQFTGTAIYFLVFLFILGAVLLFAAAFGVYRGKAWPRGALVVAELLAVIVSFTYMDNALAGVSTLISGAVVLVCLFTPALNEHMAQRRS